MQESHIWHKFILGGTSSSVLESPHILIFLCPASALLMFITHLGFHNHLTPPLSLSLPLLLSLSLSLVIHVKLLQN